LELDPTVVGFASPMVGFTKAIQKYQSFKIDVLKMSGSGYANFFNVMTLIMV